MAGTRWLDAEEQCTWRAFLTTMALLDQALDRQLQRDSGMPLSYYVVLAMLSESPGRSLRMAELADATNSSQSRISHAVTRLEEAGWVRRQRAAGDARGYVAVLTDAGLAALESAAPGHVEAVRRYVFNRVTADQVSQLGAICRAVLDELDPEGAASPLRPPTSREAAQA